MQDCGNGCSDLSADPKNCGSCNHGCNDTEYCDASSCVCKPGLVQSPNGCVDPTTNPNDCGGNGPCGGNTPLCEGGTCVASCGNNLDQCNNACVNFDTDPLHCGKCDKVCNTDEVCVQGKCKNWQVGVGCNTCPCSGSCQGDFQQCCTYPGDQSLVICVDANDCP